jgi:hypothetical protein
MLLVKTVHMYNILERNHYQALNARRLGGDTPFVQMTCNQEAAHRRCGNNITTALAVCADDEAKTMPCPAVQTP